MWQRQSSRTSKLRVPGASHVSIARHHADRGVSCGCLSRYYTGSSASSDTSYLYEKAIATMASASSSYRYTEEEVEAFDFFAMVFPCLGVSWAGKGVVKGSKSWYVRCW